MNKISGEAIGVLGRGNALHPHRTAFDKAQFKKFDRLQPVKHSREGFQHRTQFDMDQAKKFDPWFSQNIEYYGAVNKGNRGVGPQFREDYCGAHRTLAFDNVYNKNSYNVNHP